MTIVLLTMSVSLANVSTLRILGLFLFSSFPAASCLAPDEENGSLHLISNAFRLVTPLRARQVRHAVNGFAELGRFS